MYLLIKKYTKNADTKKKFEFVASCHCLQLFKPNSSFQNLGKLVSLQYKLKLTSKKYDKSQILFISVKFSLGSEKCRFRVNVTELEFGNCMRLNYE